MYRLRLEADVTRILVPVDGSAAALRAVGEAVALGKQLLAATEIILLNVQPHAPWGDLMLAGKPSELAAFAQQQRTAGEQVVRQAQAVVEAAGMACRGFVEIGDATYLINDYVGKYHCDQIVMGTRGLGRVSGVLLGSVANKVLHLARVPVMLVK